MSERRSVVMSAMGGVGRIYLALRYRWILRELNSYAFNFFSFFCFFWNVSFSSEETYFFRL